MPVEYNINLEKRENGLENPEEEPIKDGKPEESPDVPEEGSANNATSNVVGSAPVKRKHLNYISTR